MCLCILLRGPAFTRPTSHSGACTLGLTLAWPWGCLFASCSLCPVVVVVFFSSVAREGCGHHVSTGLRLGCLGVRQLKLLALLSSPCKTKTFPRKADTGPSLFEVFDCDLKDFFKRRHFRSFFLFFRGKGEEKCRKMRLQLFSNPV